MSRRPTARLAVLVSGNGSNLQAILDACAQGQLAAQVVVVVSNRPEAHGLARARAAGVAAVALLNAAGQTRAQYDTELARLVSKHNPDWVVLAGWMRILTAEFLDRFPSRVINLHPALPGAFPGTHAIERAYEAYVRGEIEHTGVMVHLVPDEAVDAGPVLAQTDVTIYAADTLAELEARVHATEHRLLVDALATVIEAPPMTANSTDTHRSTGGRTA